MELSWIIAKLLETNNFVSLPGIGSFVQSYQSAKLSDDGKTFLPPGQYISFDTNRTFNDEAIERFLSEHEIKSPSEAKELTEAFVKDIKANLDSQAEVRFAGIGSLKMVENVIGFTPCTEEKRLSSTFGLKPISVTPKLTEKVSPHKGTNQPAPVRPTSRKKRGILVSVTIIAFIAVSAMLLFFFVPSVRFWKTESSSIVAVNKQPKGDTLPNINTTDIKETQQVDSIPVVTDKKQALFYEETKQADDGMYYIISGSFTNRENAQRYFNALVENSFKPEILEANGIFRVAKCRYSNRNRALKELERMRKEKPNESVWLLGL